ncbi:MAG: hypothetical protein VZR09_03780 [Candidatus Gastranaerophilaceae bacterium]|nr:hypothetical protein [Candidatus Gastranaerophilaceae bacterium]
MKYYKKAIPVKDLAKIIEIHHTTLLSWLCHYTLSAYMQVKPLGDTKNEYLFKLNNDSINALKEYLSKKNQKYLHTLKKKIRKLYEREEME